MARLELEGKKDGAEAAIEAIQQKIQRMKKDVENLKGSFDKTGSSVDQVKKRVGAMSLGTKVAIGVATTAVVAFRVALVAVKAAVWAVKKAVAALSWAFRKAWAVAKATFTFVIGAARTAVSWAMKLGTAFGGFVATNLGIATKKAADYESVLSRIAAKSKAVPGLSKAIGESINSESGGSFSRKDVASGFDAFLGKSNNTQMLGQHAGALLDFAADKGKEPAEVFADFADSIEETNKALSEAKDQKEAVKVYMGFAAKLKEVYASWGAQNRIMDTAEGKWKRFKGIVSDAYTTLGQGFMEKSGFKGDMDQVNELILKNEGTFKKWGEKAGEVYRALADKGKEFLKAIGMGNAGTVSAILDAVLQKGSAFFDYLTTNWPKIVEGAKTMANMVVDGMTIAYRLGSDLMRTLIDHAGNFSQIIQTAFEKAGQAVDKLKDNANTVAAYAKTGADLAKDPGKVGGSVAKDFAAGAGNGAVNAATAPARYAVGAASKGFSWLTGYKPGSKIGSSLMSGVTPFKTSHTSGLWQNTLTPHLKEEGAKGEDNWFKWMADKIASKSQDLPSQSKGSPPIVNINSANFQPGTKALAWQGRSAAVNPGVY